MNFILLGVFLGVVWSKISNPSAFRNGAFSVCFSNGRVFVVGFDEGLGLGAMRYRAELYSSISGERIGAWSDKIGYSYASLLSCSVFNDKLYAIGVSNDFWSILEFDNSLNLANRVDFKEPGFTPFSIVASSKFIYVSGVLIKENHRKVGYVVRVNPGDLTITNSIEVTVDKADCGIYASDYNEKTSQLVLGGFYEVDNNLEWPIAFLGKDLELVKVLTPGFKGPITGLAIDYDGFIYVVDGVRVAKLTSEGEIVAVNESAYGVRICASNDKRSPIKQYVIVVSSGDLHIMKSADLKTITSLRLPDKPSLLTTIGTLASENDSVYVALTQVFTRSNWNWVVYKVRIKSRGFIEKIIGKNRDYY